MISLNSQDWEHRQEEDRMLIERLLILVRNILHVPPNTAKEQRTDDDASVHDQVLWWVDNVAVVTAMWRMKSVRCDSDSVHGWVSDVTPWIALCVRPANERWSYNVTSALIGGAHTQNDLCNSSALAYFRTVLGKRWWVTMKLGNAIKLSQELKLYEFEYT